MPAQQCEPDRRRNIFWATRCSAVLSMQGVVGGSRHDLAIPAALPLRTRCFQVGPCSVLERSCIRTDVDRAARSLGKARSRTSILAVPAAPAVRERCCALHAAKMTGKPANLPARASEASVSAQGKPEDIYILTNCVACLRNSASRTAEKKLISSAPPFTAPRKHARLFFDIRDATAFPVRLRFARAGMICGLRARLRACNARSLLAGCRGGWKGKNLRQCRLGKKPALKEKRYS